MNRLLHPILAGLLLAAAGSSLAAAETASDGEEILGSQIESKPDDWVFIDNGRVRLGIKTVSGGAIAWFSTSDGRNLVNHWDHGRLIQQSYYGDADGSMWNRKPWRWNPVQGGDWKGNPAKMLSLTAQQDRLSTRSIAKHWASGEDLTNVVFEQTITLSDELARIRFRMTYQGEVAHEERHHEIPAVFVEPDLDTLVLYDGEAPWTGAPLHRSRPGWPNESRSITEHWAAYVDEKGQGIGVLVPRASELTCYRFGDGRGDHGACSYFAPLTRFAVTPGLVFEYDVYLTIGSVEEIRERFRGRMVSSGSRNSF